MDNNGKQSDFALVKTDYQTQIVKPDNILYVKGLKRLHQDLHLETRQTDYYAEFVEEF